MKVLDLGITDYQECYKLQKKLHAQVRYDGAEDCLILTEHYPVITIGRSGKRDNVLVSDEFLEGRNVQLVQTDRGGDVTYHGPGQLIAYPIVDLKRHYKDVRRFLNFLESVVINTLSEYNINSYRTAGKTGVWTDKGKIASIGIGVSGWVSFHGLALNVDCDLTPFGWINPCGFRDVKITRMADYIAGVDRNHLKERLLVKKRGLL